MEISEFYTTVESIHAEARRRGLNFQACEDEALRGRILRLNGREYTSFGSCSYLGLEFHPALVEGVVDAVRRYGTQFAYSRAYIASPQYREAEALLSEIFGGHAMISLATALGHQSVLPAIATEKDAIVLDNQAHHTIQKAATLAQAGGATVEIVRHFELDDKALETVERLARRHRTVYFAIDGVYSMYGDCAPIALLHQILDVAPNVRVYVDDAHGMSWVGKHGRGYFLSRMPLSPRIVFGTSLNKAYSAAGGCFVFTDEEERERVRLRGGPYAFSGPPQPPMLGAIVASARLHLTGEITRLQHEYQDRAELMNRLMLEYDLPLLSRNESPIFFLRMGKAEAAYSLAERMMDEGFYVNTSTYPMVPLKRAGMRVTVTALHTPEQIRELCAALAHHLPRVLDEHGIGREELDELFAKALPSESWGGIDLGQRRTSIRALPTPARVASDIRVDSHASIQEIDRSMWDRIMEGRGTSSWDSLAMAERVFRDRPERHLEWQWRYLIARGREGRVLAATYGIKTISKDDMFMRPEVSAAAEERRKTDPYFLTTETLVLGSALSEGHHLFLDRTGPWEDALEALLEAADEQAESWGAEKIVLRDFAGDDPEMDAWMHARDWIKVPILDNYRVQIGGTTEEEMLENAGRRTRRLLRGLIETSASYTARIYGVNGEPLPDASWVPYLHRLYLNVADRKLRINDYRAPVDLIPALLESPSWEVLAMHLDPSAGGPANGLPVSWGAMHRHGRHYMAFLCGSDRAYVDGLEFGAYRQLMLHSARRARELGAEVLHLGYDAEKEKQRFGAVAQPMCMYVRHRHHDHGERMYELVTSLGLGALAA